LSRKKILSIVYEIYFLLCKKEFKHNTQIKVYMAWVIPNFGWIGKCLKREFICIGISDFINGLRGETGL